MTNPTFAPRAKIEIVNQAAIFKSACRALAWLNWIPHWDGLQSVIEWLAMAYLQCDGAVSVPGLNERWKRANEVAEGPTFMLEDDEPHPSWILSPVSLVRSQASR